MSERIGERRYRLHRVARRLEPRPEQLPYYISLPPGPHDEKAAGWYMVDAEFGSLFLGANAFTAELDLTQRLTLQLNARRHRRKAS